MIKQQHDMKKAFTGMSGPYVLKDEYCSAKVLQEFWCLPISKRTQVLEKMSTLQMKGPNGDQQRSEFKNIDKLISIFDKPHVDAIKEKVQRILNGNIRRGFDGVKSRLVSSDSRQQPHVILNPGMQRYVCGTPCFQFQTFKICSHTLAVAADNNELSQFIAYFIETYRSPNLAAAATANVSRHSGKKPGQTSRKRKATPVASSALNNRPTLKEVLANTPSDNSLLLYSAKSCSD